MYVCGGGGEGCEKRKRMAARSKPTASLSLSSLNLALALHQPRLAPDQIPMLAEFPPLSKRHQDLI